ncbi:MAG: 16S rRNA (cytosine(1402)-N(4))-methyltransferase RsmH [Clostridiales bacterium]|nr:16S rRNA (cytosine(1402)-N(4))-methyltransferase RsmH [Clostridiales bacterium]
MNTEGRISFSHEPVLLNEVIDALAIKPDGIYLDGTAGGGGHSSAIAARLTGGKLIALDRDPEAVAAAGARLSRYGDRARVIRSNFSEIDSVCDSLGIAALDGVLLDLGVSSHQLDTPERGFSYISDAPLDMRMDTSAALCAADVVNGYPRERLEKIIFEYGEEKFASRIASKICEKRETAPIKTTGELVNVIKSAIPAAALRGAEHHPAMRTFQAIRIEVNGELDVIEPTIRKAVSLLAPGGRIAVITFHSLEDRRVKQTFAELARGCVCPPDFPVCVCGHKPEIRLVTKKPVTASPGELERNTRSHSAKLRTAEKL